MNATMQDIFDDAILLIGYRFNHQISASLNGDRQQGAPYCGIPRKLDNANTSTCEQTGHDTTSQRKKTQCPNHHAMMGFAVFLQVLLH